MAREPAGARRSFRPFHASMTRTFRSLRWPLAALAMIAALLWPALWNGFPIVFYDTGGYLDAAVSGILANGRSTVYGMFLRLGISTSFWPNIVVQAGDRLVDRCDLARTRPGRPAPSCGFSDARNGRAHVPALVCNATDA